MMPIAVVALSTQMEYRIRIGDEVGFLVVVRLHLL